VLARQLDAKLDRLGPAIKAECGTRLREVLRDPLTQINMSAAGTALVLKKISDDGLTADEDRTLTLLRDGQAWVRDMQDACRQLIEDADEAFASDDRWPPAPDGLADLAAQF